MKILETCTSINVVWCYRHNKQCKHFNRLFLISSISISFARQLSIGILDISGFESLQENSLEQLFINITNEQIQQFHQKQIFHVENKEYIEEGIQLPPNIFQDNTAVLQLIFDVSKYQ